MINTILKGAGIGLALGGIIGAGIAIYDSSPFWPSVRIGAGIIGVIGTIVGGMIAGEER